MVDYLEDLLIYREYLQVHEFQEIVELVIQNYQKTSAVFDVSNESVL